MTRGYPWTYTISAANTWEYKTVTVAGSTDGTWLHDHREGMRIFWNMGSGTNRSGTAGQWSTSQYTFPFLNMLFKQNKACKNRPCLIHNFN